MNIPVGYILCTGCNEFHRAGQRCPTCSRNDHQPTPQIPRPEPVEPAPALAWKDAREAPRTGRPLVRITHRRVRLLDVDAKFAAVKDVLDGLQYAGLLHSDKEGEIDLEVLQEKVGSYDAEETLVSIIYPEP